MADRCILQAKRATLARPAVLVWAAHMERRDVSRHGSAPTAAIPRYQQGSRDAADPADHAGQTADPPVIFWGWRGQRAIEIQEPAVR